VGSEFDHVFICVSVGGEEAGALAAFGLTEGTPNVHPGQGTASRRFFFANSYLELLWVTSAEEAQSKAIQPTYLWERWRDRASGVCPLGLGFRPKIQDDGGAPFSTWEYHPPYLPSPFCLHVATNANLLTEPMLFCLPLGRHVPEVLTVRIQIYRALQKWELMQTVGKQMALFDPDEPQWTVSWAYATRRCDSIAAARLILLDAVERLPNVAIFHYNLACYDCQLGSLEEAKARLARAFELKEKLRPAALEDEDLKPLWDSLGR
jgi:tetratricopeptide (TPR) repeat protein